MKFNSSKKRNGFTLMEIVIAVFIVAILAALTVPIVNRQLAKADEYSYYLAYKTVEKMAGQIAAMGDPCEIDSSADCTSASALMVKPEAGLAYQIKNTVKAFAADSGKKMEYFLTSAGKKFAKTEEYIFNKLFPKAFAGTTTKKVINWDSAEYDWIWLGIQVCNGVSITKTSTTNTDGSTSTTDYSEDDFGDCSYYKSSGSYSAVNALINTDYITTSTSTLGGKIKAQTSPSAKDFCESYICSSCWSSDGDDDDDDTDYSDYVDTPTSDPEGTCTMTVTTDSSEDTTSSSATTTTTKPEFDSDYCTDYLGCVNMTNDAATESIDCVCLSGYTETQNNDRACCPTVSDGTLPYYYADTKSCVYCSTDFNPQTGTCCPKHSTYVSGDTCTCITGYGPEGVCSTITSCPSGTTLDEDEGVCVTNPPIIKAARFCELIEDNYNISSSDCDAGFTTATIKGVSVNYNSDIYSAAVGTDGNYLSIAAQSGAFSNLTPNITFANGLPMWILADKAASIPGLSYTTADVSKTQNICVNLNKHSSSSCSAADSDAYYCSSENTCFTLDSDSIDVLGDARNCCAAADISALADIAEEGYNSGTYTSADIYKYDVRSYAIGGFTVFVDINGQNKGSGTLWDDVFPFFIGADGTVYPAYPLDADSNSRYLGGNSEKQLAVDVYYYQSDSSGNARKKITAFPNVSYARGVCSARHISKYTPYCKNLGSKYNTTDLGSGYISNDNSSYDNSDDGDSKNPCDSNKCFVSVRKKLKSF